MTSPLRRAGHLRLEDGRSITWTVAEGRRGRRWREAVRKRAQTGIRHSLLLEIDPDGRFAHLELSTDAGLLTLHPEGDGTIHGNVVTAGGVEHVRQLAWDRDGVVLIDGSVMSRLAAFPGLAKRIPPGSTASVLVLRISADLRLMTGGEDVTHVGDGRWALWGPERIEVDDDGLLRGTGTAVWPLEDDD